MPRKKPNPQRNRALQKRKQAMLDEAFASGTGYDVRIRTYKRRTIAELYGMKLRVEMKTDDPK